MRSRRSGGLLFLWGIDRFKQSANLPAQKLRKLVSRVTFGLLQHNKGFSLLITGGIDLSKSGKTVRECVFLIFDLLLQSNNVLKREKKEK
jgi:hypothetical protein